MRRRVIAVAFGVVVAATLADVGVPPAAASASVSPGGATVTAGQGATARATFTPTGAITCGSVSGGGDGVGATLDTSGCQDGGYTTTLRVSTRGDAAPGTYTFTVEDTADGGRATFVLTVRAPPPPPTTAPPTTAPPPTLAPPTTAPPPTTTLPPTTLPPATTVPATTTTAPVGAEAFAPLPALIGEGLPERGAFLPLAGAGFRECLPLTRPCGDPAAGVLLLPARSVELSWVPPAEGSAPLPQLAVRAVPPLQPVGVAPPTPPASSNYLLTFLDLADGGQPKSLRRGLNQAGELVAPSADQPPLEVAASGAEVPPDARTFLAAQPFREPSELRTSTVSEAAPAIPVFLGSHRRVLYGVRADPGWDLDGAVIPLLGNGRVPFLVRTADGQTGLVVPVPPGVDLAARPSSSGSATFDDGRDRDDGLPVVPLVAGLVGVAALGAGVAGGRAWRRRRAEELVAREREAAKARAESIIRSQPRRFRR